MPISPPKDLDSKRNAPMVDAPLVHKRLGGGLADPEMAADPWTDHGHVTAHRDLFGTSAWRMKWQSFISGMPSLEEPRSQYTAMDVILGLHREDSKKPVMHIFQDVGISFGAGKESMRRAMLLASTMLNKGGDKARGDRLRGFADEDEWGARQESGEMAPKGDTATRMNGADKQVYVRPIDASRGIAYHGTPPKAITAQPALKALPAPYKTLPKPDRGSER